MSPNHSNTPIRSLSSWRVGHWGVLAAVLLFVAWIYWRIGEKRLAGFTHDDGVYLITAKALAMGQGPKLLHLVTQPFQIKYPFLYSLLLVPVWWLNPSFPANIPWFTAVSVLTATAGLGLVWVYLWRFRQFPFWACGLITVLTASNFYFAYFASAVMAEGPYLLFSFLALVVAEYWLSRKGESLSLPKIWGLALLCALVFHTRQIGLSLVAALTLVLFLRNQWRQAWLFLSISLGLTLLPWSLYGWLCAPEALNTLNFPFIKGYANYTDEWLHNAAHMDYAFRFVTTLGSIVDRIQEAMFTVIYNFFKVVSGFWPTLDQNRSFVRLYILLRWITCYALTGYFIVLMVRAIKTWWQEKNIQLSLGTAYLLCYLGLVLLWGYEEQVARFMVAVVPLLWAVFLTPFFSSPSKKWPYKKSLAVIFLILGLIPSYKTLWSIGYVRDRDWIDMEGHVQLWPEYLTAFDYIRRFLPANAHIATSNDVLFYLNTNRKTFYANRSILRRQPEGKAQEKAFEDVFASMQHYGVDYVIVEPDLKNRFWNNNENPVTAYAVHRYPQRFRILYVTPHQYLKIYRLMPKQ